MSENADESVESRPDAPPELPEDLTTRLTALDADELRAVVDYAEALLPTPPTPAELVGERPGERILEVRERDGFTEVVKEQPCADGCDDCPHGPYLYRVRVRPPIRGESEPTLRWDLLGPVSQ